MVAPSFLPADHPVEWLTAAPLWTEALKDPSQVRYRQPALLRFASDQFMDDLAGLLQSKPAELKGLVARAETWEQERVGWAPLAQVAGEKTLKLYQPAHNRFYMVAATLACHRAGLPDRAIANDRQEKAGFVLRRLVKNPKAKQINPNDPRTNYVPRTDFGAAEPSSVLVTNVTITNTTGAGIYLEDDPAGQGEVHLQASGTVNGGPIGVLTKGARSVLTGNLQLLNQTETVTQHED
jgi:hypothetical protein